MKTFEDLKDEIARIDHIYIEGFDSNWVFRKFARDQALINIALIKPYTDKYALIVRFLVTGKDEAAAAAIQAAIQAASATATVAATYVTFATVAAASATSAIATSAIAAATSASYATYATHAADADSDYTASIASLNTLANEYLALLACAE